LSFFDKSIPACFALADLASQDLIERRLRQISQDLFEGEINSITALTQSSAVVIQEAARALEACHSGALPTSKMPATCSACRAVQGLTSQVPSTMSW